MNRLRKIFLLFCLHWQILVIAINNTANGKLLWKLFKIQAEWTTDFRCLQTTHSGVVERDDDYPQEHPSLLDIPHLDITQDSRGLTPVSTIPLRNQAKKPITVFLVTLRYARCTRERPCVGFIICFYNKLFLNTRMNKLWNKICFVIENVISSLCKS